MDDQAQCLPTNDQQRELSSAASSRLTSPPSSCTETANLPLNSSNSTLNSHLSTSTSQPTPSQHSQQNSHLSNSQFHQTQHQQQEEQLNRILYLQSQSHAANIQQQHQQQQHQQRQPAYDLRQPQYWASLPPMLQRRQCSGVDKLILAAMMEESAAAAMAQLHDPQPPTGRGIGYFNMRDATMEVPTPSNKSELELYRLLERANLVGYFGTFLNFGGDDVQQLSEADEEEFLEIMSLVGMTQKPLHVRRLQKALIEWRESKDLDSSCFKRPQQNFSATRPRDFTPVHSSAHRQQPSPDPSIVVESPATTPNSINSATIMFNPLAGKNYHQPQQQQYVSPHELLIGAPKRPRLMDNMMAKSPKNLAKTPPSKQADQDADPRQQELVRE